MKQRFIKALEYTRHQSPYPYKLIGKTRKPYKILYIVICCSAHHADQPSTHNQQTPQEDNNWSLGSLTFFKKMFYYRAITVF